MTTPHGSRPRHLSSSPFAPKVEEVVEVFAVGDRVCHDLYGLGSVTAVDTFAVTVDFAGQHVRIKPPYTKLEHL